MRTQKKTYSGEVLPRRRRAGRLSWYWRVTAPNGEKTAVSAEGDGFTSRAHGRRALAAHLKAAREGRIVIQPRAQRRRQALAATVALLICGAVSTQGQISTPIGSSSGDGFPAALMRIVPGGLDTDAAGNLYLVDVTGHRIRRSDAATGTTTTVAGTGAKGFAGDGGPATAALLNTPRDLAVAGDGTFVFSDQLNNRVRIVRNGIARTVAGTGASGFSGDGGPASLAMLSFPAGVALSIDGDLLIADSGNLRVRKVTRGPDGLIGTSDDMISTVVGNGLYTAPGNGTPATGATLAGAADVRADATDNWYVLDGSGCRLLKIGAVTRTITVLIGTAPTCTYNGDGLNKSLNGPSRIALDMLRGAVYIAESFAPRIRKLDLTTLQLTTVFGTGQTGDDGDGPAGTDPTLARLKAAAGLLVTTPAGLYIGDKDAGKVRLLNLGSLPQATPTAAPPTATVTAVPPSPTQTSTATRTRTTAPTSTPSSLPTCMPPSNVPCV